MLTREILDDIARRSYSDPLDREPVVHCTRTFTVLPLRYAVVGGSASRRKALPELPDHLRHPHNAVDLSQASYAIRPLREGFLYLMEKRRSTGRYTLRLPWRIAANGSLTVMDPEQPWAPPPPAFDPQAVLRGIVWTLTIHELDDLLELRLFYSPDPLTAAAQQALLRQRNAPLALDIGRFVGPSCTIPEPHVLTYGQLDLVADFAAERDPALRNLLDAQLFATEQVVRFTASRSLLMPAPGKPRPRGVAIVVEDAIGITQTLNAWRNGALEHLKDWLEHSQRDAEGKPGPSNERKVLVAQAFTELQKNFSERKVAALTKHHSDAMREQLQGADNALLPGMDRDWWEGVKQGALDYQTRTKRSELEARAQRGEFSKLFEERYLPRVNVDAMRVQLGWFETESREAQRLADARAADHLAWLQHPHLLDALAHYDQDDLNSGLCFAHQTGLCVVGMEGVSAGAQLLGQWWRAETIEPGNLALRSFVYNQRSIEQVLQQTRIQLSRSPEGDDWQQLESGLKLSKELAAQFSRVDGHLELIAQHGHINSAGALAWLGQLGRETLRAGTPSHLDRALHRRLSSYLVASLGEQALNLRMAEHAAAGHSPSPGRVAAPITRRLDQAYVRNLTEAHSNAFYRLRISSGLLLLEASLLLLQGRRHDKDQRFWSEVSAAGLTSAAAGLELLAVGTEQALASVGQNSVTARGAQISLGRYRLWGAGLATVGGLVSIGLDVGDAIGAHSKNSNSPVRHHILLTAYFTRVNATLALLIGQGGMAFAQGGAYFSWLALRTRNVSTQVALRALSGWSADLAASRAAMLLLGRMTWVGGVVVIFATSALFILDGNALEKWSDHCCFRLSNDLKGYNSTKEELNEFFNAISEVL
ncbi:hypothetical protein LOY37_11605 [Pseudomonas sp. B21-012]|uniref:T6SS effector BTH_I2691 family protein n=1 Tax=Pseudomonas sp. B21-012 TaxID=2895472 RepID=UPI00215E1FAE|nr:T6SS effector BTH_I2691 family protein [Pseudomonas sp. B21-012]UVM58185.1 hypothetical protein LOY37_11605 [Pseudomonas sp. B21-012]